MKSCYDYEAGKEENLNTQKLEIPFVFSYQISCFQTVRGRLLTCPLMIEEYVSGSKAERLGIMSSTFRTSVFWIGVKNGIVIVGRET